MKRDSVKEGRWSWLLDDDRVMRDFLMKFVEACERRRVSPEAVRCLVDPVGDLADPRRYHDVWDALGDRVSSDCVARVLTPNVITLPQDLTANAFMALVQEKLEREGFEVDSTLVEMLADGSVYPWFGPGACLEWSLWTPSRTLNGRDWGGEDVRRYFADNGFCGDARAFLYWCAVYAGPLMESSHFWELTTVPDTGGWWRDADGTPCGAFLLREGGPQLVSTDVGAGWRGFGTNTSFVGFRPAGVVKSQDEKL